MKKMLSFVIVVLMLMQIVVLPLSAVSTIDGSDKSSSTKELVELRTENTKHYKLSDDIYEAVSYPYQIHKMDSDGSWQDIDIELYDDQNGYYSTRDKNISFSKFLSGEHNRVFEWRDDDYEISMSYLINGVKNDKSAGKITNHDFKDEKSFIDNCELADILNSQNKYSEVSYVDVEKNVDLRYDIQYDSIKESIVINGLCEKQEYTFELDLDGLYAESDSSGKILIKTEVDNIIKYYIPSPYMYDAKGEVSYLVKYKLQKNENNCYTISVIPDWSWIYDDEREYPIVIDPTIRVNNPYIGDTYVNSSYPDANYEGYENLWIYNGTRVYIKQAALPNIPSNAEITSAKLNAYYYYYDSVDTGYCDVYAYKMKNYWNKNTITWNNSGSLSRTYLSESRLYASENDGKPNNPALVSFDITTAFISWSNGTSSNYGIQLEYVSGTNTSVILKSYEAGENQLRPFITLTYKLDTLKNVEEGVYWFSSKASNGPHNRPRLMDVRGNNSANNTVIQQWDSESPELDKYRAQLYRVKYVSGGYYKIISFTNPNYHVQKSGSDITIGDSTISTNYLWRFIGNETDGYSIVSISGNNYAITVPDNTTNGLALIFSNKDSSINNRNKWKLNRFDCYIWTIAAELGGPFGSNGHSFITITNTSSDVAKVGYVTVLPEQQVSIGTYGKLFSSGSSGGSDDEEGIFYNQDFYKYQNADLEFNGVALLDILTKEDLIYINNNYLKNPSYNNWSVFGSNTSNCALFAQTVWNSISDFDVNSYHILTHTPGAMINSISNYSWHLTSMELSLTEWYGMFDDSIQKFKYYYGTTGAFPIVPYEIVSE